MEIEKIDVAEPHAVTWDEATRMMHTWRLSDRESYDGSPIVRIDAVSIDGPPLEVVWSFEMSAASLQTALGELGVPA
jgi:hypothetical protein